jgi:hypothetical protein
MLTLTIFSVTQRFFRVNASLLTANSPLLANILPGQHRKKLKVTNEFGRVCSKLPNKNGFQG